MLKITYVMLLGLIAMGSGYLGFEGWTFHQAVVQQLREQHEATVSQIAALDERLDKLQRRAPQMPSGYVLQGLYGNETAPERLKSFPITGRRYQKYVVQSVRIPDVRKGDLLHAEFEFQLTTPYRYNVMVASLRIVASSPNDTVSTERLVAQANGENIDNQIRHKPIRRQGWWVAKRDYPELYLNAVGYAASTASKKGHRIRVDQKYGRSVVAVYRRVQDTPADF